MSETNNTVENNVDVENSHVMVFQHNLSTESLNQEDVYGFPRIHLTTGVQILQN